MKARQFIEGSYLTFKSQLAKTIEGNGTLTKEEVARCYRTVGFWKSPAPRPGPKE